MSRISRMKGANVAETEGRTRDISRLQRRRALTGHRSEEVSLIRDARGTNSKPFSHILFSISYTN
jgi:hypothetical protein